MVIGVFDPHRYTEVLVSRRIEVSAPYRPSVETEFARGSALIYPFRHCNQVCK